MPEYGSESPDDRYLPVPYEDYEEPPDPMYGDVPYDDPLPDNLPCIPDQGEQAYPVAYEDYTPILRQPDIAQREQPRVTGNIHMTDGRSDKHRRDYSMPLNPDGTVDSYALARAYIESIRNDQKYPGEVDIHAVEQRLVDHYKKVQQTVADNLDIPEAVRYKLATTPLHVFTSKKAIDAVIRTQASGGYLSHTIDSFSPLTGGLWLRTPNAAKMHCGLARLIVQSAAATLIIPEFDTPAAGQRQLPARERRQLPQDSPQTRGARQLPAPPNRLPVRRQDQSVERQRQTSAATGRRQPPPVENIEMSLGHGYDRPDIMTETHGRPHYKLEAKRPEGLHRAVTDMATAHVLAIGGYREAPRLSNIPINVILDGVVRRVAFLRHEAPKAVADELLRGYYSGDLTGINNVRAALGRWGMYQLFGIDGTETGSDLNNLARTLDAPYIAENARALREGRSIKLYNW